ncbi:MAG: UDP-N-acetylmuramoyl-L-alanine--D-glutamate ligase [Alphaproteobacteria bacterium]|nr:UDP-N-acetylmuramoyl-L-alanine--D-glutamate ligase [Alphaproteobacteria bacterium]
MIPVPFFKGQTVAVFGLARSGISAGRALMAGGAKVIAWDDKDEAREAGQKAGLAIENLNEIAWNGIAALILSPGVPLTHPAPHPLVLKAQAARAEVIGDVELFFRAVRGDENAAQAKIVCITGTNGKSTTTALIGHLLSRLGYDAEVGGNIGKPVLELAPPTPRRAYVLELSSYQLDLTPSVRPDVAVLINITPDHLDRHGTMENYAAVKANIVRHQQRGDIAVIGVADAPSSEICTRVSSRNGVALTPVSVGKVLGRGIFVLDGKLYDATGSASREVSDLRLLTRMPGAHNWQNAAIAYAAVRPLVKDPREIAGAMTSFPGLSHRMEIAGQIGRVRFVNDSKATNADAAARALACYPSIYWIAGGKAKSGGIESLASYFPRIRKAYLIGDAANAFASTLGDAVAFVNSGTLETAMRQAAADAEADRNGEPVVLLSPACASFDQFRDFEQRGNEFKRIFAAIAAEARLRGAA